MAGKRKIDRETKAFIGELIAMTAEAEADMDATQAAADLALHDETMPKTEFDKVMMDAAYSRGYARGVAAAFTLLTKNVQDEAGAITTEMLERHEKDEAKQTRAERRREQAEAKRGARARQERLG